MMSESMWHEREVSCPQLAGFTAGQSDPAGTGGDDVKADGVGNGWHLECPGLSELGMAVERAAHSKRVQYSGQPIRAAGRDGIFHAYSFGWMVTIVLPISVERARILNSERSDKRRVGTECRTRTAQVQRS